MRTASDLAASIDVALRRKPANVVLRGGRVFDLATGELRLADVALCGERIAAVGEGYEGVQTVDCAGKTLVPGFVDAHCHVESSLLTPFEWERAVLPHGITSAVCDPHELANVAGTRAARAPSRRNGRPRGSRTSATPSPTSTPPAWSTAT